MAQPRTEAEWSPGLWDSAHRGLLVLTFSFGLLWVRLLGYSGYRTVWETETKSHCGSITEPGHGLTKFKPAASPALAGASSQPHPLTSPSL